MCSLRACGPDRRGIRLTGLRSAIIAVVLSPWFLLCSPAIRAQIPRTRVPEPVPVPVPAPRPVDGVAPEGPQKYYVDITQYGAQSANGFDNTAAILAAANAVCAMGPIRGMFPVLFIPPGSWLVAQPQLPSTSPAITLPCGLEIDGSGDSFNGAHFSQMAHGSTILDSPGPHPNAAPTIAVSGSVVMRNLIVTGYNQAVSAIGAPLIFENVCLNADHTGMPENTALRVSDSIWLWYTNGCLGSGDPNDPVALLTGDLIPGTFTSVGSVYFSDLITEGGGFKYIQRTTIDAPPGDWVFRNITMETAPDLLEITQDCTDCNNWIFANLEFDMVQVSDSACDTCAVVNMNAPTGILSGVSIHHSNAGRQFRAITVTAGRLGSHEADNCWTYCAPNFVDNQGNPIWNFTNRVTLSGGTATLTFAPVIFIWGPPICVVNDETTINGAHVTATTTSMTISGGPSDVVDYFCSSLPSTPGG